VKSYYRVLILLNIFKIISVLLGIRLDMVKQVTSALYYAKEVQLKNGRVELLEVTVKEMRIKKVVEREWHRCVEVDLQLVNMAEAMKRELEAEDIVDRLELLRDSWLQLAGEITENGEEKKRSIPYL
jgi:hypothetical protein